MTGNQNSIIHFYDEFFRNPVNVQANERILYCYKKVIGYGFKPHSTLAFARLKREWNKRYYKYPN